MTHSTTVTVRPALIVSRFYAIDAAVSANVFSLGVALHKLIFRRCRPFVDDRDDAVSDDEPVELRVTVQSLS